MKWKGWAKEPIWGKEVWNRLYCVRICLQRQGSFQLCGIKPPTKWETNRPWRGAFNVTLKVIWLSQLWICGQTLLCSDLCQDFSSSFLGPGAPVCFRDLVPASWIWGGVQDTLIYSPTMMVHRGEMYSPKGQRGIVIKWMWTGWCSRENNKYFLYLEYDTWFQFWIQPLLMSQLPRGLWRFQLPMRCICPMEAWHPSSNEHSSCSDLGSK